MMKHECKVTVIDKKCFADFQGSIWQIRNPALALSSM